MFRWLGLCLSALILVGCATRPPAFGSRSLTVLVSIDGFRADYLDRGRTPVLSGLAATGARGVMRPSFPAKTFPNHYVLVTGLRPDRNGIVDNVIEDPDIPGVTFRMSNHDAVTDRRWWDQGEPIWVRAEQAGVTTATMFWPGSEAPIRGVRPSLWRAFDQSLTSDARVDQVLAWLDLPPAERPAFVTLYFDLVDTVGHNQGPDSPELGLALSTVDAALGRLTAGLKARGQDANLVVVADHGMAALSEDRILYIDDLLPTDSYRTLGSGAFVTVYPAPGREAEVLSRLTRPHPHLQCWEKSKIPARFHYGRNPRVAPVICLPETGWRVSTRDYRPARPERGAHGYDNESPDMAAVFVASGPSIRRGVVVPVFDNVDVYPLLARLIGIRPAPGDGNLVTSRRILVR